MTFEYCKGDCIAHRETAISKYTPYSKGWRQCLVCRYATQKQEPARCYCCNCRLRYKSKTNLRSDYNKRLLVQHYKARYLKPVNR